MNECEKYSEMISAMLDGELDAADSERLIAHMSSCARCRELYELLSAVTGSEVWELPGLPEGLHEHIMSGVKNAASVKKKEVIMRKIRPWAMAAACIVIIAGVVLGVPRFRMGNSSAPAALNTTAAANDNSAPVADNNLAPADAAAPAEAPAADDNGGIFGYATASQENIEGSASNDGASSGGGDETTADSPEAAPVPAPDPESEEPKLDIDIDRSVLTVESNGKSTTEKLTRTDTLIWLRAIIEDLNGGGFDAAKLEIFRREGTDYEVYFYHDGSKLMGSLTEDLADSIELKKLGDFAQFSEMADNVK